MQTLKDVFKRENERLNLMNVVICIGIIVGIVIIAFGLQGMTFSPGSTAEDVPAPAGQPIDN